MFYDIAPQPDAIENRLSRASSRPRLSRKSSSALNFIKRKLSLNSDDEDKLNSTISKLVKQTLNISHGVLKSTRSGSSTSETSVTSDEMSEPVETKQSAVITSDQHAPASRTGSGSSSSSDESGDKNVFRQVRKYEILDRRKLKTEDENENVSLSSHVNPECLSETNRTKVGRKMSFPAKPGAVKSIIKKFEEGNLFDPRFGRPEVAQVLRKTSSSASSECSSHGGGAADSKGSGSGRPNLREPEIPFQIELKDVLNAMVSTNVSRLRKSNLSLSTSVAAQENPRTSFESIEEEKSVSDNTFHSSWPIPVEADDRHDMDNSAMGEGVYEMTKASENGDSGWFDAEEVDETDCVKENLVEQNSNEQLELRGEKFNRKCWSNKTIRHRLKTENEYIVIPGETIIRTSTGSDSLYTPSSRGSVTEDDIYVIDDFPSSDDEHTESAASDCFVDPLYQIYSHDADLKARKTIIEHHREEQSDDLYIEPSHYFATCANPRKYWRDAPEVIASGVFEKLSKQDRKLQEAKYEVLTSEASYMKSLNVLEKHYMKNIRMVIPDLLSERDFKIMFGNVSAVRKSSEDFFNDLEKHWQDDILLSDLCVILQKHATNSFKIYTRYAMKFLCMTEQYHESMRHNQQFKYCLELLSRHKMSENLSLDSFLALPIQRITRLPLLMQNILEYMDKDRDDYKSCIFVLETLKKIAQECDEEIDKKKRCEEMLIISQQISFPPDVPRIGVVTNSRYLVHRAGVKQFIFRDKTSRKNNLHLFLFDDLLMVTRKAEEHYIVVDYCPKKLVQAESMEKLHLYGNPELTESNPIIITLSSNHRSEKSEMVISFDTTSDRQRWLEALTPSSLETARQTLEEEPDGVQVIALNEYKATRPDELSLCIGDVVFVVGNQIDGWYQGEKLVDGEIGWFPAERTTEMKSQSVKSANLKLKKELRANDETKKCHLNRRSYDEESYA